MLEQPNADPIRDHRFNVWPEEAARRGVQFERCTFSGVDAIEAETDHARFDTRSSMGHGTVRPGS
ncbi:MAG: hypothetical protein ACP5QO_09895 [Clostridia bacterium]